MKKDIKFSSLTTCSTPIASRDCSASTPPYFTATSPLYVKEINVNLLEKKQ